MIEIIWLSVLTVFFFIQWAYYGRRDREYRKLFQLVHQATQAQTQINTSQYDINNSLAQNLEILGVHTKLIPPTVSMQAEAFLKWHNDRRKNNDG